MVGERIHKVNWFLLVTLSLHGRSTNRREKEETSGANITALQACVVRIYLVL